MVAYVKQSFEKALGTTVSHQPQVPPILKCSGRLLSEIDNVNGLWSVLHRHCSFCLLHLTESVNWNFSNPILVPVETVLRHWRVGGQR